MKTAAFKIPGNVFVSHGRSVILCCVFSVISHCLNAQANWVKQMGGLDTDIGAGTAADLFGNIYTIGTFSGTAGFGIYNVISAGKGDVFITKASASDGDVQWVKQLGNANDDNGNSIVCDPAGNVYFTGRFSGSIILGSFTLTSVGTYDAFIAKIDNATGAISWARRLGGTGNDSGLSVTSDGSGNIFASGYFQGSATFGTFTLNPTATNHNIYILRVDGTTGNVVWVKGYGSSGYSYGNTVACDNSGDVYLTGNFESALVLGNYTLSSVQYQDVFVSKHYAATGNVAWASTIGGSGSDNGSGVTINTDGFVYCTGKFEGTCSFGAFSLTSNGNADVFVSKIDAATGAFSWAKQFGDEGHEQANAITHDAAGYLFITGQFNGYVTFDDHLISSAGNADGFIVKIDGSAGQALWASPLGGPAVDSGYGICTDQSGGLYCTGAFQSAAFLAGPTYTTKGASDIFVVKLMSATVGIDENTLFNRSLHVMPVPFHDQLTINFSEVISEPYTINLSDISGKNILKMESDQSHQQLNLEILEPGIYFLTVKTEKGQTAVRKIIKQ